MLLSRSEPKTQKETIKELAADESLSEETRESAQQALDELVAAQIERDKAQAEARADVHKLEQEAESIEDKARAARKKSSICAASRRSLTPTHWKKPSKKC